MRQFWVFGYGSLMWRPGFPHEEAVQAHLQGAHRSLCIYSHVHRGTPERPGLVLGLDRGGACRGIAYRVNETAWPETLAYLRKREQATAVYLERSRPITLIDRGLGHSVVTAVTYVADRRHPQYAGRLSLPEQRALVLDGEGQSGPNRDYVLNTVSHLTEIGIMDAPLFELARLIDDP